MKPLLLLLTLMMIGGGCASDPVADSEGILVPDPNTVLTQNIIHYGVGEYGGITRASLDGIINSLEHKETTVKVRRKNPIPYEGNVVGNTLGSITICVRSDGCEQGTAEIPLQQFVDLIMETNGLYYEPETTSTTKARLVK